MINIYIYLRKGTTIGTCHSVEVWETSPQDISPTVVNQRVVVKAEPLTDRCVLDYLSDLLHRSSKHLGKNPNWKSQITAL